MGTFKSINLLLLLFVFVFFSFKRQKGGLANETKEKREKENKRGIKNKRSGYSLRELFFSFIPEKGAEIKLAWVEEWKMRRQRDQFRNLFQEAWL